MLIAVISWILAVQLLGLGNTVGYHRLLTHRAFVTRPAIRAAFTLLGAMHGGSPMMWVGLHRLHHNKSDNEEDPHSPIHGFWWAHSGWLIGYRSPWLAIPFALSGFGQQAKIFWHDVRRVAGRNPPVWRELCPDLMQERLMRVLDIPFMVTGLFLLQLAAVSLVAGWSGVLWLWLVHLFLTNSSWSVNSVCHWPKFGAQPWETRDWSRDVRWLGWMTNGESFHNSHHRYPRSARHALHGGQDLSWWVISGLCKVGLASEPWLPKAFRPPGSDAAAATKS